MFVACFLYIVKVNILITISYLLYRFLLCRLTFTTANRIFLLSSLLFSLLAPLWVTRHVHLVLNHDVQLSPVNVSALQYQRTISWTSIITCIYGIGSAVMVLLFFWKIASILYLRHRSKKIDLYDTTVNLVSEKNAAFSFFKMIFINADADMESIYLRLNHEKIHVAQWHSIDVVIAETAKIICWLNPFAWWFAGAVRQNLEYIADQKMVSRYADKKQYQYLLLQYANKPSSSPGITNSFNFSPIKNRIMMINKMPSSSSSGIRFISAGLLLIAAMIVSSQLMAQEKTIAVPKPDINSATTQDTNVKPIVRVNGKVVPTVNLQSVNPQHVKSIKFVKNAADTGNSSGTIEIKTDNDTDTLSLAAKLPLMKVTATSDKPLIIIDGKKEDISLFTLDPNIVKSIKVLKGESATNEYGDEAKNGALLITTKQ